MTPNERNEDPLPGPKIQAFREVAGLTQSGLARAVGLSRGGTISDYETGRVKCTGTARIAILYYAEWIGFPIV